jgi:hypothetical protein
VVKAKLPWLDVDRLTDYLREDTAPNAVRYISCMGAMTAVTLAAFGRDVFRLSQRERFIGELERFAEAPADAANHATDPQVRLKQYETLLELHELSIGKLVSELRDVQQKLNVLKPQQAAESNSYASSVRWRNVDVVNESGSAVAYEFVMSDGRIVKRPSLEPGAAGTTGFVVVDELQLRVSSAAFNHQGRLQLQEDQLSYLVRISDSGLLGDAQAAS